MTVGAIESVNVSALVVGIEKYDAGERYNLNGPASDALKFAGWLLDRGVHPGGIKLFLSPLEKNSEMLTEAQNRGLDPDVATRDKITRAITYDFLGKGGQGKLLYVFWAGHGFITKISTTTRRLFFSDTDTTNKWNLDFDSLLQAFQTSSRGTAFPQQIFFVDACANPIFQDFYPTIQAEAAGEKLATGGTQAKAEQFALFATAEYEVATNLSQEGTGRFAKAILEELREQPLLPDMREIAQRIKQNFREKQHLEPVFWSFAIGGSDREGVDNVNQRIAEWTEKTAQGAASARNSVSTQERFRLINTLNSLPLVEFEVLLTALNPPPGIVPPSNAAQELRSAALLQWIEGSTGPGLNEIQAVLGQVMVASRSSQPSVNPQQSLTSQSHPEQQMKLEVPVELNKEEREGFRSALKHAFPKRVHLETMLEDELGEELDAITYSEPNYDIAIRQLMKWAESEGKLQDLFEGALHVKPGNPKLRELQDLWLKKQ